MEVTKKCTKCGETKSADQLVKDARKSGGVKNICRACSNAQKRSTYDKIKSTGITITVENKICCDCEDSLPASEFYQSAAQSTGLDSRCKFCRRVKLMHKRDKSNIPSRDLKAMFKETPFCAYCKIDLRIEDVHFDHLVPISRGGRTEIENLVVSCADCNRLKHTRTDSEFRDFLKRYLKREFEL